MSDALKEVEQFLAANPQVETIELLVADLDGVLRGKRVERSLLKKVYKSDIWER